jgi:hypothetical protein
MAGLPAEADGVIHEGREAAWERAGGASGYRQRGRWSTSWCQGPVGAASGLRGTIARRSWGWRC